jgi:hypothetical protein
MMPPLILALYRPNGGPVMAARLSSGQLEFQPDMPVWSVAVATMRDAVAFLLAATSHALPPNDEAGFSKNFGHRQSLLPLSLPEAPFSQVKEVACGRHQ